MFVELIDEEIEDGAILEAIVEGGVSVRLQIATLLFVVSEFFVSSSSIFFIGAIAKRERLDTNW